MASSVSPYQDAMGRFETFKQHPDPETAALLSASLESAYRGLIASPKPLSEQIRTLSQAMETIQAYLRSDRILNRRVEILPAQTAEVSGSFRFAAYDAEAFLRLAVKVLKAIRDNERVLKGEDLDDLAAEVILEMEDDPEGDDPDAFAVQLLGANVRWMIYPTMATQVLFDEIAAAPKNGVMCQISDRGRPELREDPVAQFGFAYVEEAARPYVLFYLHKGAPRLVYSAAAAPIQEIVDRMAPDPRYIQVDLLKDSVFGITYR